MTIRWPALTILGLALAFGAGLLMPGSFVGRKRFGQPAVAHQKGDPMLWTLDDIARDPKSTGGLVATFTRDVPSGPIEVKARIGTMGNLRVGERYRLEFADNQVRLAPAGLAGETVPACPDDALRGIKEGLDPDNYTPVVKPHDWRDDPDDTVGGA